MKFGIDLPNFGEYGDPHVLVELACEVEAAGWDGIFLWDHIARPVKATPMADPWIALSAIACRTEKVKIGTMITPLARRRPWKVARETVTLDHLSKGRLILGVGLGEHPVEFDDLGEETDLKARGELLDEGLEILDGLWKGSPLSFSGKHYHVNQAQFLPPPYQGTHIPIIVAGRWPNPRPFRRAARWDGVFPLSTQRSPAEMMITPADIQNVVSFLQRERILSNPFEVFHAGLTSGTNTQADADIVRPYSESGVTWWLERINHRRGLLTELRQRIRQGPPRL